MPIEILPNDIAGIISAHQVMPDPFVLIKELVENSIDANATEIKIGIYITNESIKYLVEDNGDGIGVNENFLAEGGTSKITRDSYGCKGSALYALKQVADIQINTRCKETQKCTSITVTNSISKCSQSYRPEPGTTVEIVNFHVKAPIREKHISKNMSMYIKNIVAVSRKYSIVHGVSMFIEKNNRVLFSSTNMKDKSVINRAALVYGIAEAHSLFKASFAEFLLECICLDGISSAEGVIFTDAKILESEKIQQSILKIARKLNKRIIFYMHLYQVHPDEKKGLYNVGTRTSKHHRLVYKEISILSLLNKILVDPKVADLAESKKIYPINHFISKNNVKYTLTIEKEKSDVENVPVHASKRKAEEKHILPPSQLPDTQRDRKEKKIHAYAFDKQENLTEIADNHLLLLKREDLAKLSVIGQFNAGFIITTLQREGYTLVYAIDQHSADEAVNYEHLKMSYAYPSQKLIQETPLILSEYEQYIAEEHREVLKKHGFVLSPKCKSIVQAPIFESTVFGEEELKELLSMLMETHGPAKDAKNTDKSAMHLFTSLRKLIATKACRSSIMIGDILTQQQQESIVKKLSATTRPWNCPHGRPTIVLMQKPSPASYISNIQSADAGISRCQN